VSYNSCRNRHCPKCGGAARAAWLEARRNELLPVPYFHLVFTLPHQLAPLALLNPQVVYGLLFRTAARTLQEIAANPRHLGARIGGLMVLHTWGQNLEHHPHVHCVVPGGGLSADGQHWIRCRPHFFLPVKVLSRVFRGKFLAGLRREWKRGRLKFPSRFASLANPPDWQQFCGQAAAKEWVVYAKPPCGGSEQVLKYLARYTHRVALSNDRLLRLQGDCVTFSWKNYAAGGHRQLMTLAAVEFLRRFLQHVLPKGFVRIRQFGLWSNGQRTKQLARCRELLSAATSVTLPGAPEDSQPRAEELPEQAPRCPYCGRGSWFLVEEARRPSWPKLLGRVALFDSS
jgi:hypothetical protein